MAHAPAPPSDADAPAAVDVLPLGAILQAFRVGARNLVLSFPRQSDYVEHTAPFFGETIGRVANRVAGGQIRSLNRRTYQLSVNEGGKNTLHGGLHGWGKKTFQGPKRVTRNGRQVLELSYLSPSGDEGFPGAVECRVWYSWSSAPNERGASATTLDIEFEVEHADDGTGSGEDTVVAVTNHSYFNVSPDPTSIAGTTIDLATHLYQEVDANQIPTGRIAPFPGVVADRPISLGTDGPSFDHSFVVNVEPSSVPLDTRPQELRRLITMSHPESKLTLVVESTEPAVQVYTGEGINVPAVDGAPARGPRSGIAIEPQRYVHAANEPDWQGMVLVKKGQVWGSRSRYTAWEE